MSLKQPPSVPPPLIPIRKERIQVNELKIGDSIMGMTGKFSHVTTLTPKEHGKLLVSTDAGENMVLERWQMVAVQR